MTGLITTESQFSFQLGELPAQLAEHVRQDQVGNWRFQFDKLAERETPFYWYVGVDHGKVMHSGSSVWSSAAVLKIIRRYSRHLMQKEFQVRLKNFKELVQQEAYNPLHLVEQLKQNQMVTDVQLSQFLQTKIMSDFDQYSRFSSGKAEFIFDPHLVKPLNLDGLDINDILELSKARQSQWHTIRRYVPSLGLIPTVRNNSSQFQSFTIGQQQKIMKLVQSGENINQIARRLAKDHLDVAQMFANLIQAGVITLIQAQPAKTVTVMVIDDSSLMLTQFKHWLKSTQYQVLPCQDAADSMSMIRKYRPAAIFIDINMPVICGFDLVKQIRSTPVIANIPIAILTGEQKLSNRWRAKWSSCEFVTKPMTASEQGDFADKLQELIHRLLSSPVDSSQA
jgi:CheY-like chemotaxis protein